MRGHGPATRSPIRRPVRRVPGETLQQVLFEKYILEWAIRIAVGIAAVILAITEWARALLQPQLSPYLYTALAACVCGWAWWKIHRTMGPARDVRLGMEGERAVAEALETLAEGGYRAFHDLPSDRGDCNIDHVLVGPAGVFAIETKTRRKPVKDAGQSKIHFDGETVRVGGGPADPAPVVQARAAADEVRRYLEGCTGLRLRVTPAVLYPGWYVERGPGADATGRDGPWVLHPTAFVGWVLNAGSRRGTLPQSDLKLIVDRLERWPVRQV